MFNEFELKQKEIAFYYSKLRFEEMNNFYTGKTKLFKDKFPLYSFVFITISRFINYKEDIWIKNKKTKKISTLFSKEILDDFIFRGKFTSTKIHIKETRKQQTINFEPIIFFDILKEKKADSAWIIDNIRDSLTHGHFYIDFDKEKIIIKNNHEDRLLHCSINFELFFVLNELITEERIGGYSDKKLITFPLLYRLQNLNETLLNKIKNETHLKTLLKNEFIVSYCKVTDIFETNQDKKYQDLSDFYNFNVRLAEKFNNKYNGKPNISIGNEYTKIINSYIKNNMKNYNIEIFNNHLDNNTIDTIIKYIREDTEFYNRPLNEQGMMIHEILKSVLANEKITLERGVMDFVELYSRLALKSIETNKKLNDELDELIYINTISFKENKKLANLFMLATNNFVCNKEPIYDKYFEDYNEFDIKNFEYKDYSYYNQLVNKIKNIEIDIVNATNSINKAENAKIKANNNLLRAPKDRKSIIQNNINNLDNLINQLKNKKKSLNNEKLNLTNLISSFKTDINGNYLNNSNKSFFNHLRNAFAHNHITYLNDDIVFNRKILLEDYDDENNLTFSCVGRYYDFVKLFNNDLFLEAINNKQKKVKTLKIKTSK